MIEELIAQYNASQHPWVRMVREFLARHNAAWMCVRLPVQLLRLIRSTIHSFRAWMRPPIDRRLRAIVDARGRGGVPVQELDRLWEVGLVARRVVCYGSRDDLDQIELILRMAGRSTVTRWLIGSDQPASFELYDLVVIAPSAPMIDLGTVQAACGRPAVVRIEGEPAAPPKGGAARLAPFGGLRQSLRDKLRAGEPLRVVLLNDVGFQYGAGNALKRQAASFLLNGWHVAVVAWKPDFEDAEKNAAWPPHQGDWLGVHRLPYTHRRRKRSDDEIIEEVAAKVAELRPDVVVVGNLHGAEWPISLLSRVQKHGIGVVAYMHDCYFVTGRCAYPVSCELFKIGCNATCPTPHEYPRLAPDKIAAAWQERADVFAGLSAVPLVANSRWTQNMALQRFGASARVGMVHLGVDHELFAPLPRAIARRLLKIPGDKPLVVMGAVDVRSPFKGGPLFAAVHRALVAREDVDVILFGRSSERLPAAKSFGYVSDERLMPFILSAADIFVGTATMEAFGQTLLEASACGLPIVAFDVGGIGDIVLDRKTGFLVERLSAPDLLQAVDVLVRDPDLRRNLGKNGRERIENHFTLQNQARAWIDYLQSLW